MVFAAGLWRVWPIHFQCRWRTLDHIYPARISKVPDYLISIQTRSVCFAFAELCGSSSVPFSNCLSQCSSSVSDSSIGLHQKMQDPSPRYFCVHLFVLTEKMQWSVFLKELTGLAGAWGRKSRSCWWSSGCCHSNHWKTVEKREF